MKPKIVVAEDHASVRAMIISLLQDDFDLTCVVDGEAAIEAVSILKPDVVVLDVSMPILDGIETAKRLKAQACTAKLVFLSLFADADHVAACLAVGGNAYVSKMRMATDLICAITEVLAGKTFVSPVLKSD